MKLHPASFVLGIGGALVVMLAGRRLRPIAVEMGALGVHMGSRARSLFDRQREHLENLLAEIEERALRRAEKR